MNHIKHATIAILAAVLVLIAGCGNPFVPDIDEGGPTGSFYLSIDYPQPKSVLPDFALPAAYDVTVSRAGQPTTVLTDETATVHTVIDLAAGAWSVEVVGKNAAGEIVATGSNTVTVVADVTTPVSVTLFYSYGVEGQTGDLALTFRFPDSMGIDDVKIALAPLGGSFAGPIALAITDTDPTGPYSQVTYATEDLPCTSYTASVEFRKSGVSDPLATVMEAIQIYRNLDTTDAIQLETTQFRSPPAAPATPTATDLENNHIRVNWDASAVLTETGFRIERHVSSDYTDETPVVYTLNTANLEQYEDPSLVVLTDYYYRFAAFNAYGQSDWTDLPDPARATKVQLGDYHVYNLAALAALEHVTRITGFLNIQSGATIDSADLNYLADLRVVVGGFHVQETSTITDLAALSGLQSVGFLYFNNNSGLQSLDGLQGLTSIPGYLQVSNNPQLGSLTGLDNVASVGTPSDAVNDHVTIYNNDGLPNLTGLGNLETIVGGFNIDLNDNLVSLAGLESLVSIGDETPASDWFGITNNANLGSLSDGVATGAVLLDSVVGFVLIAGNPWLLDVKLPSLSTIGTHLEIRGNARLEAISDMDELTSVGTFLKIGCYDWVNGNSNPLLADLSGLGGLQSIGTDFAVYQTPAATMEFTALQTIGGRFWFHQNHSTTTLSFPALATVGGEFGVYDNNAMAVLSAPLLSTVGDFLHLRNLEGAGLVVTMDELDSVANYVNIESCDHLVDLGLDDLATAGLDADTTDDYLIVQGCPELATISFPLLNYVDGRMEILDPTAATSISMPLLSTVGSQLHIRNANGAGLTITLTQLDSVGDFLYFQSCAHLATLVMDDLDTVGFDADTTYDYFRVTGCQELTSISCANLLDIDGELMLDNLERLATISIPLLETAKYVYLESLNGSGTGLTIDLSALASTEVYFYAAYCQHMTSLTLPSLATVGDKIIVRFNGALETVSFPAVTSVAGLIDIDGNNALLTISGFDSPSLTTINGFALNSGNNSNLLTTLDAFSSVTTINGNLILNRASGLASITGFESLQTVAGHVVIDTMGLTNLGFLNGLTDIGGHLHIVSNPQLTSLDGLSTLINVGIEASSEEGVIIENNDNVGFADLDGLHNIETIDGTFRINGNEWLATAFTGENVGNITTLGLDFLVYSNPRLQNLTGLGISTTVRDFHVYDNAVLTDIGALSGLTGTTRDFKLTGGNPQLQTVAFTSLLSVGQDFIINDTNLSSLSGFGALETVGRNLYIASNDHGSFTSLVGLGSLSSIGGEFNIDTNSAMTSLDGLTEMELTIGGRIRIFQNDALTSLDALLAIPAATILNGDLIVDNNDDLPDMDGLEHIGRVIGTVYFWNNTAMTTLFTGEAGLAIVDMQLQIGGSDDGDQRSLNANLANLNGLTNLVSVGTLLKIDDCPALTDFSGIANLSTLLGTFRMSMAGGGTTNVTALPEMPNLTHIGGEFQLYDMDGITDLGFINLTNVSGAVRIINNGALPQATINAWLLNVTHNGEEIYGNL